MAKARGEAWTPRVEMTSHRYLYATTYGAQGCYNGASKWSYLAMAADARRKHAAGWRDGRARDCRAWVNYSRNERLGLT
jgi:hypothetical protein